MWVTCARTGCATRIWTTRQRLLWCHEHPGYAPVVSEGPRLDRVANIRQHKPWLKGRGGRGHKREAQA